jgi:DNA-binding CsgD family transcriptional regulator/tetratricopeptide (TPR) repeat protein
MAKASRALRYSGNIGRLVPGRVRELGALHVERERSALGELRVALILGDAGLGKTRLAVELLPGADELARGLICHSSPLGGMPLFGPWAEILGLHAADVDTDGVCRACGSGFGDLPALPRRAETTHDAAACAEALRYHFVEWIPGLLAKASAERPIIVVLDDVHQGHDVVWEMLLRLAWDFPASQLFVLATARPAELAKHRTAVEVLHALEQEAILCRIQLYPLSSEDLGELAGGVVGRDRVPSVLVEWLMVHAQGNPRFAVGLLEALLDNGADLQAPALDEVPEKLASWVRTEVARLQPPTLALVELLAVVDDLIDPDDLARITGQAIDDIALALERLVQCGLVVEQAHDQSLSYRVSHSLVREVLYTGIGGARRRMMHRRVAETLRESGQADAAASHFVRAAQAGDGEAIDALIRMAAHAERRGRCSLAWATVSRLRELLPVGDERWHGVFDALFQRSSWGTVDRTEDCVAETTAVRRMRQLLAGVGHLQLGDLQRQAEVRLWLAGLFAYGAGDLDAGQHECQQVLTLCQRAGCEAAARRAAIELAKMRGLAGDLRGEELAARQLCNEAKRVGDQRGIAEALRAWGHALGLQGRFDAAEDVLLRSVELATAAARLSWMSQSLALLASLDVCRGHLVSARSRWAQAAASSPHYDPMVGRCGALIELLAGDLALVAAHARQAQGHHPADRFRLPVRLAARAAMAAAERGHLVEARRHLDAMTRANGRPLGILEPWYWWAEATVARAEGRLAAAASVLERAVDGYSAMNVWALRAFVLADLAEIAVVIGDPGGAARAAASADDNARRTGAPIHQALHQFATAWALICRGCHDLAARAALGAMDGFDSSGYALLAARARVAYATAVRRSDRGAAQEALRAAAAAFDACGAVVRRDQARALLHQLESQGRCTAQTPGPGSLTTRERQVAELASGGYTAPQIATRLHIGVRTVETHLARSYLKLGVTSKQQLVAHGAELGLAAGR